MNFSAAECEQQILRSWQLNAKPWARAVQAHGIASRREVTDGAILEALRSAAPDPACRVLDIGCGEGWLARALNERGLRVTGVDAIPELVAEAQALGGGEFAVLNFEQIAALEPAHPAMKKPFDVAVCNFSLLGGESVAALLAGLPRCLGARGRLIIQTLHPLAACGDAAYRDGWRTGTWAGFGAEFSTPAPWYFRTFESWVALLRWSGFEVLECREPTAPGASAPASVIFIGKPRGSGQTDAMERA